MNNNPPQTTAQAASFIPLAIPVIRGREWEYVKECLDTGWVSYVGSFVTRFEKELAAVAGASHAVAMNSGTAALQVALRLAGVTRDSEVLMPGTTFVAPANAARYLGAWPTLVGIDPRDWQLDVDGLAEFLRSECRPEDGALVNRHTGRRIAAILPIHLLGGMGNVDGVAELAAHYDLPLVEDAAECLGATFRDRPIAAPVPKTSLRFRAVVTSFNGNKIITTGGGGALLTEDEQTAQRAKHLSTTAKADPIEFFHDEIGYNYRLSNIAAAIGVAQMQMLSEFVAAKRAIAARYHSAFQDVCGITAHPEPVACRSTFWMYTVALDRPSRPLIDALNAEKIQSRPIWVPIHRLPAFSECYAYRCESCDELQNVALSLPCTVDLTREQQDRVIQRVLALLGSTA